MSEVCDICSACKEAVGFEETEDGQLVSECCGAPPLNRDIDLED